MSYTPTPGTWPMCDADIDRMERAAIAVEALTEQRNELLAQVDALIEVLRALLHEVDEAGLGNAKDYGWPKATAAARAALAAKEPRHG